MKITTNFIVEVDGAKFTFEKPTFKYFLDKNGEGPQDNIKHVFEKLKRVEGVFDDTDKEMDAGTFRALDLPVDVVTKILNAWNAEVQKLMGIKPETEEKKDSATT